MINDALRLIRVFHDMSQTELAERLGVPKSRISEVENNKRRPTLELIERYSEEFGLPLSTIMFFAEALPNARKGEKVRTAIAGKVLDILKFIERQAND